MLNFVPAALSSMNGISMDVFIGIGRETLKMFLDSSLYLLLGFFLAGVLAWLVPARTVARFMGGGGYRSVVSGALRRAASAVLVLGRSGRDRPSPAGRDKRLGDGLFDFGAGNRR